jgi:hypothetical protein
MPNHVHLVSVPPEKNGLHLAIGEAHRRYTRMINFRQGWCGHLWQGRFTSYVMDERYLLACVRYVENNPVWFKNSSVSKELRIHHDFGQNYDEFRLGPKKHIVEASLTWNKAI